MKRPGLVTALLLSAILFPNASASHGGQKISPAKVLLVRPGSTMRLDSQPTHKGFVLVALGDCSVLINGHTNNLKAGDHKEVSGGILELAPAPSKPTELVLVEVLSASQPLTVQSTTLARNQEVEDASDRNLTLLVAVDALRLSDVRDLSEEEEPWKSAPAKAINLQKGQTVWLQQGMHRLRNAGRTTSRFVTIEW